jgi:hypothetical protein
MTSEMAGRWWSVPPCESDEFDLSWMAGATRLVLWLLVVSAMITVLIHTARWVARVLTTRPEVVHWSSDGRWLVAELSWTPCSQGWRVRVCEVADDDTELVMSAHRLGDVLTGRNVWSIRRIPYFAVRDVVLQLQGMVWNES